MKYGLFLSIILFASQVFHAQPNRSISLDVNSVKGQRSTVDNFCVGAGRANEGLRADWQQQLTEIQKQIHFRYIRFHGLLHDDMGVYKEDAEGNPIYNWQYIDKLHDFLLRVGIRPFVELSFMPAALASGAKTVFWWKGNGTPPKDYGKWEALITALVKHFEERYGKAEVEKWYFELWNEPNHPAFFSGNQADYFKLYASTAKAIKAVSSTYRVGGPATAGSKWIGETIRYCAANNIPLDFISTHEYGVSGNGLDEFGKKALVMFAETDHIASTVKRLRDTISASPMPKIELHITEWSSSYSSADPVHDTYINTPYVLNVLRKTQNTATSMSYWTFTDIFEEVEPPMTPLHGGFGLLNLQGIRKPTFYAYQFLNQLGRTELNNSDSDSYACTDDKKNVQVLFWNLKMPALKGTSNKVIFRKDIPAADAGHATITVANIKAGTYKLQVFKTGYRTNDAFTTYYDMGLPSQLTRNQEAQLKTASAGKPVEEATLKIAGKSFSKTFGVKENDVYLVKLTRL